MIQTYETCQDASRENEAMDLFDVIGSYGPWQRRTFWVFFYMNMIGTWQLWSVTFLAPNVDFKCADQLHFNNGTTSLDDRRHRNTNTYFNNWTSSFDDSRAQTTSPFVSNKTISFDDRCEVVVDNHSTVAKCTSWNYDVQDNIVSEWDLVCDRQWLVSFAKSVYQFGYLLSVIVFGQMADWLGRFPVIVVCYTITTVAMFLSMLSTSYTMYAVLRFFQAFGRTGLTTTGVVLVMEIMGPGHRAEAGILIQLGWTFGFVSLVAVTWFIRNWIWLQCALGVALLPVAFCYRIIPESPRWLLMRGQKDRLQRLLTEAVELNKRELKVPVKDIQLLKENEDQKAKTLIHLLKLPKMRNRLFIMLYLWLASSFTYYGLSFNTNELAGDMYLNFFLSGLIEFPSTALLYFCTLRVGRRPTLVWFTFGAGIACVAILAVPTDHQWLETTLVMLGKFSVNGSYGLLVLYTNEIYPTVVRTAAVGSCQTAARIGSILAPFVKELGTYTHYSVPNVLYGVLALTSGLLSLLLPETKGKNMPDTMEEGENFGQ
ncbi:hypothetical protein JTE90_008537 [Oedothorax gibbosus]|uniref:Major facilitator superfamily (MFS) profile domain-containing protein n=1 Tax=Oedothorax gibbosus TaxID=931172 RepID=A0AAV6VII9_9ARAC|nr:hypothetical protein JTE90_008537 [Oedothorax gibbosus]